MACDELRVNGPRGGLEIAGAALLQEQREEVGLVEEVADLVEQLRVVAGERGVRDLVCLLDRVRHDRACRLLAVPRTFAAETLGQRLQLDERVRQRQWCSYWVVVALVVVAVQSSFDGV